MERFFNALTSGRGDDALPEGADLFGKLIGSWSIDYIDTSSSRSIKGEWHFARVLEGMAVQDVILLPGFECGTTLRVYVPGTGAWEIAYCFAGRIMRLTARKEGGRIVLTSHEDERRKWVFVKIEDDFFHWQDVTVRDDGEWHVEFDLYAARMT